MKITKAIKFEPVNLVLESRAEVMLMAVLVSNLSEKLARNVVARLGEPTTLDDWDFNDTYDMLLKESGLTNDQAYFSSGLRLIDNKKGQKL